MLTLSTESTQKWGKRWEENRAQQQCLGNFITIQNVIRLEYVTKRDPNIKEGEELYGKIK